MVYPQEIEQKLGFDQIRQRLKKYCLSIPAAERVDALIFTTDVALLRTALQQNLEFKMILEKSEEFPSRYYFDPTGWQQKIALEGNYLEEQELLQLADMLATILLCKKFLHKAQETYPSLYALTEPVMLSGELGKMITDKIDDNAQVRDSASPDLARVRRRLRDEQGRLRRLTDQVFRRAVEEKWTPDGALPTIREGRLVIPILAEHKRRFRGFVLDESATGQTVFMEPAEMLDANNEIRELELAERREVIKILQAITTSLRQELETLVTAFDFLATIDLIRAKGRLALELNADLPMLQEKPCLVWYTAVHPLLYLSHKGKADVVPLNIELNEDDRLLLVSGPNAGGKSVCLKTVGLLQYMLQCGLLVPMSDRSRMGIFQDIFLDIGDQQSIENDLSTYSSHLKNMSVFIGSAASRSLILMDELGSGTDPDFGGAIAQAVLQTLLKKKLWGVITTHYYNLKLFAGQHAGIRNAAMRFDEHHLRPLYQLDIGKPGSSFALEIARKTGLPPDTLEEAERLVGKDLAGFETLVRDLERERQELSEKIQRLEKQETDLRQSLTKYETLSSDLETRRRDIIEKAREEAQALLRNTNREIEKTIRHIRENNAQKKETRRVRKNLEDLSDKVKTSTRATKAKPDGTLQEGDRVRITGQQGSGVIQVIKGKNVVVQFGELKSVVKIDKLEKADGKAKPAPTTLRPAAASMNVQHKRVNFNSTLDIRGKRADEVIPMLESFIDTAILLSQGELRILHGKGGGVLRKIVREQLRHYKEVESMSDEHVERGGDGITVVVLK